MWAEQVLIVIGIFITSIVFINVFANSGRK
jgi:hypothetical protein